MVSAQPAQVVIECPHCGMRYQLPGEAIGPKGREVACAHCGSTWHATARPLDGDDDRMFDDAEEQALDDAFLAAEKAARTPPSPLQRRAAPRPQPPAREPEPLPSIAEITAAIAPRAKPAEPPPPPAPADAAGQRSRQREFDKRQVARLRQLPLAKVRRIARIAGMSVLLGLLVAGVAFRTEIVRQFPDLAGAYEALGLGVNVVGLELRDVRTLVSLRNGQRDLMVDARIVSVAGQTVPVPPVVITLLDEGGRALYAWSVTPDARRLASGEMIDFTARLSGPPLATSRVRLTFADGNERTESALTPPPTPSP